MALLTKTPGIAPVMTKNRFFFFQILHYLHFVNNKSDIAQLPKDSLDYDTSEIF